MSTNTTERITRRAMGVFDVRDHYREQTQDNGLAATVTGPVRFDVEAVITPSGRFQPDSWVLDTRPSLSGLPIFLDRVIEERPVRIARTLPSTTTSVQVLVSCPGFQPTEVAFTPDTGQAVQVDLEPSVDYAFGRLANRAGEQSPALLRGSLRDSDGSGISGAVVSGAEAVFDYRTQSDGGFVLVIPDSVVWVAAAAPTAPETFDISVHVQLQPDGRWHQAVLTANAAAAGQWNLIGPVMGNTVCTCPVTVERARTVSVPQLDLDLS